MRKVIAFLLAAASVVVDVVLGINYFQYSSAAERAQQGIVPLAFVVSLLLIAISVRLVTGPWGIVAALKSLRPRRKLATA